MLSLSQILQVLDRIVVGDAFEIEYLAAAQDREGYLVLLGGGQDEDGIGQRLFVVLRKALKAEELSM